MIRSERHECCPLTAKSLGRMVEGSKNKILARWKEYGYGDI